MKIGIVGSGAIGLTAGYELAKKGHAVTVFESGPDYGGLMGTVATEGDKLEKLYHHIFTSDTDILDLITELGLQDKMLWQAPKSGIFINKKLYPFSSPLDLLMFKELSFIDRIAMGLLIFKAKFLKDWTSLEKTRAKDWIIEKAGRNVYDRVWGPLIKSKFDHDSDEISAVWIWNKFKLRGTTRGKNVNRELFGYMSGSFGLIYDKLVSSIKEMNGSVFCSSPVNEIHQLENKTIDVVSGTHSYNFDKVIFTAAPQLLTKLTTSLPAQYLDGLKKIKYKANICMLLEVTETLSPYYWITIADSNLPFVLAIEHTNLIPAENYKSHILYLSRYLDETNELFSASDDKISELFINSLNQVFPGFDKSMVKTSRVFRECHSQPVVGMEYSQLKPDFATPVANLYLASMAQIYPEDRGQNYSVRMGKEIARII